MVTITRLLLEMPQPLLATAKATAVLALVQLIVAAAPKLSASVRHLLLTTGLAAFVVIPVLSAVSPTYEVEVQSAPTTLQMPATSRAGEDPLTAARSGGQFGEARTVSQSPGTTIDVLPASTPAAAATQAIRWDLLAIYAWLTVATLLLVRIGAGSLRVWWIVRTSDDAGPEILSIARDAASTIGLERSPRLVYSQYVYVPMVWGYFTPVMLLPNAARSWESDQMRAVLLHELGHLKRWDGLTLLLGNLVTSLYWFHPQVWAAERAARRECERACDDLVLSAGTKASDYAGHLLSIARLMPPSDGFASVTLAMSYRSQLEGRLMSILNPLVARRSLSTRLAIATALVAILILGPMSAFRLVADEPEPAPTLAKTSNVRTDTPIELAGDKKKRDAKWDDQAEHDGEQWYGRAYELHHSDRFPEAIQAFEKAAELGYKKAASWYNIACGYAMIDQKERALTYLERALEGGFDRYDHLFEDSDLDSLRTDPRFRSLVEPYRKSYEKNEGKEGDRLDRTRRKYAELKANNSRDGHAWQEVGTDLLRLRQLDDAIASLSNAALLQGADNQTALYNLACAQSLRGDASAAIATLDKAIEAGFDNTGKIDNDPDLREARSTGGFARVAQKSRDLALWRPEMKKMEHDKAHEKHQDKGEAEDSNYSREKWAPAVSHFRTYVRTNPDSGRAWFNLGYALHYSSDHRDAINAFTQALKLGYRAATASYNVACAYARLGDTEAAIQWLERARTAGFDAAGYLEKDEDLKSLRSDARFERMVEEARKEQQLRHEMKKQMKEEKKRTEKKLSV